MKSFNIAGTMNIKNCNIVMRKIIICSMRTGMAHVSLNATYDMFTMSLDKKHLSATLGLVAEKTADLGLGPGIEMKLWLLKYQSGSFGHHCKLDQYGKGLGNADTEINY